MGAREERKSRSLVLTVQGKEGDGFSSNLGRRRVMPGWAYDPVQRQDVRIRLGRGDIV